MDQTKFSQNELLEMESLKVRGGTSANAMTQGGCINIPADCGLDVDEDKCVNHAPGCGSHIDPTKDSK